MLAYEKVKYGKKFDGELAFRRLNVLDFKSFKEAAKDSIETNAEWLLYGNMFEQLSPYNLIEFYGEMIKDENAVHFGFFKDSKMLSHVTFSLGYTIFGVEVIGWVRNGYQQLGIGEAGLKTACDFAFSDLAKNYITLHINEKNMASRKVAEKLGFEPIIKIKISPEDETNSVIYLLVNPVVRRLANIYGRRPIDIINCPATMIGMQHFLQSDGLVTYYEWPFPNYSESAPPVSAINFDKYITWVSISPHMVDANQKVLEQE
jgi:RimJ/RimL family protein N-acetyltransferase